MMGVEVVRNVAILASPGFKRLKLRLWLRHVAIKVIEVAEIPRSSFGIRVGRVEPFVMLDKDKNVPFSRFREEMVVVLEELGGRLGDENMNASLNGV